MNLHTKPNKMKIKKSNLFRDIFIIFALIIAIWCGGVRAQTKTPTPTSATQEQKEIDTLKEKLASKVAELRKKNDNAVSGSIISKATNLIKIKTQRETFFDIKIDPQLTKFYQIAGTQKKDVDFTDLEKGDYIIVTGPIDGKTVTANFIYEDEQFLVESGKITEINTTDFYMRVITAQKETFTLDLEADTKKLLLDPKLLTTDLTTVAKIKVGDTVHFAVKVTGQEKEKNRYSAQKLLVIPQEYFMK